MNKIDPDGPLAEKPLAVSGRQERTEIDQAASAIKGTAIMVLAVLALLAFAWIVFDTMMSASVSAETRQVAKWVLWGMTGGLVVYLLRRP